MLQQSDLDSKEIEKKGLLRCNFSVKEQSKSVLPNIKSSQVTPVAYSSKKSIKFLDPQNEQVINKWRQSIQDNKLFAETILVNAKTGNQLKPPSASVGPGSKKQNTFQKYQGAIFNQTSKHQITAALSNAKRLELSQFSEDLGIMRYIKKKHLQDKCKSDNLNDEGKFKGIKDQYF